mgnify:CR=1 FL=1
MNIEHYYVETVKNVLEKPFALLVLFCFALFYEPVAESSTHPHKRSYGGNSRLMDISASTILRGSKSAKKCK